MLGRFAFELQSKYPHLSEAETETWNRFIQKYPDFCERADYDIVVGDEPEMNEGLDEAWNRNAQYLGRYKIDAVGYKGNTHYIFEVKKRAGPSALGQILAYMSMYQERVGKEIDAEPVLVTDQERPNIRKLCLEHNIDYYVV